VQEIKGTVSVSNIASFESLMKRGYLALEDDKWNEARKYFDQVLDLDPEYAPAYVGKLCAILSDRSHSKEEEKNNVFLYKIKKEEDLARFYLPLDSLPGGYPLKDYKEASQSYQKAIRFANETYRAKLEGYNREIKKRIEGLKNSFTLYAIIEKTDTFYESGDKRYVCVIKESTCHVGRLERGVNFKILRTGKYYEIGPYKNKNGSWYDGVLLHDDGGSKNSVYIHEGDVAVITR